MADILGSLLPEGYAAPEVQGLLGGELFASYCTTLGSDPTDICNKVGSSPFVQCTSGTVPRIKIIL